MSHLSLPKVIQYPNTISYRDGSETLLYEIVSEPFFDELTTWQNKSNWALYYHLSPLRKNILSWINFGKKPLRVLELGAGCGAITSFLCNLSDSEIVAIEGSPERAKVIQARCKGAENLTIHACSIDSFHPHCTFDIITLIGVLEYAGKYEQGQDPYTSLLKRAAGWLSDQGALIVAIENQLGCKYISGCAEDHYGTSYEGINDYPHYNGVRTFTKSRLQEKLCAAGLPVQSWYYPFPDYKLPSLICSDLAFGDSSFDYMALTDIPPEPNENVNPVFSDRTFLKLVSEVSSATCFMNSFLVVASKNESCDFYLNNSDIVAVKSNVKFRSKPFQTSTVFTLNHGEIKVAKKRLYPESPLPECDIRLVLNDQQEPYYNGTKNLFDAIIEAVLENCFEQAYEFICIWDSILNKQIIKTSEEIVDHFNRFISRNFIKPLYPETLNGGWLPGKFVDLTPLNILIPGVNPIKHEQYQIIDLEWQISCEIPLQLVFDRGMSLLTQKLHSIVSIHKISIHTPSRLPSQLYSLVKEMSLYKSMNIESHTLFETWFQQMIMGKAGVPNLNNFVETVVSRVEQGRNNEALEYYDRYRRYFSGIPDLKPFDKLMGSVRKK